MSPKICNAHGTELRTELKKHGLGKYFTDDSNTIRKSAEAWLKGDCPVVLLEPYVVSSLEIIYKFTSEFPEFPIAGKCPLCYIRDLGVPVRGVGRDQVWIRDVSLVMAALFRENDLI